MLRHLTQVQKSCGLTPGSFIPVIKKTWHSNGYTPCSAVWNQHKNWLAWCQIVKLIFTFCLSNTALKTVGRSINEMIFLMGMKQPKKHTDENKTMPNASLTWWFGPVGGGRDRMGYCLLQHCRLWPQDSTDPRYGENASSFLYSWRLRWTSQDAGRRNRIQFQKAITNLPLCSLARTQEIIAYVRFILLQQLSNLYTYSYSNKEW